MTSSLTRPLQEIEESDLDLIVAGTAEAISMVEAGANEVDEEALLEALAIAHDEIKKLCAAQLELARIAGKDKWDVTAVDVDPDMLSRVQAAVLAQLEEATLEQGKLERRDKVADVRQAAAETVLAEDATPEERASLNRAFDSLQKTIIRRRIAVEKTRPDGRSSDEIRPISVEVGMTPARMGPDCSPAARPRC